jgi:hypothetical protein
VVFCNLSQLYSHFCLFQVASFKPQEQHATLLIDEIAIKSGLQYDSSLCSVVGRSTVANASGLNEETATHALVFMLAGASSRWKQIVACEFTGNSFLASEILQKIMTIIEKSHEIGVTVNYESRYIRYGSSESWHLEAFKHSGQQAQ